MFKVPDWDDSPVRNNGLMEITPKKTKKINNTSSQKKISQNVNSKEIFEVKNKICPNFKEKSVYKLKNKKDIVRSKENYILSKVKSNKGNKKNVKSNSLPNNNKRKSDLNKDIQTYDTDKLDELILDEKRQKIEEYKNDDNEEILFKENSESVKRQKIEEYKNDDNEEILFKENSESVKTNIKNNKKTNVVSKFESKKKLNIFENNCSEHLLKKPNKNTTHTAITDFTNHIIKTKEPHKKKIIKHLLQNDNHRNHISVSSSMLRDRMMMRLKAAKFRYLNEKLYTSRGCDAQKLFQEDPTAFQAYHEGYQQQVKKWPVKPLDVIIKRIQKLPKTYKIADMGCGEAELARRVAHSVRSFDLVGSSVVEACDMAHTPLLAASMDVLVYCLALMGTDLTQYLIEANRVLRVGGHLLIAEVESRFDNVEAFTKDVQKLGFSLKKLDKTQKVFYFIEFIKMREPPVKKSKLPTLTLQPCLYKKR